MIPVLCPIVPLYLRVPQEAPARAMIDAGLAPAISTDFNPGSAYVQSMPEVLTWASLRYRMTAAEALTASTLNAACSLGLGEETGSIEAGKRADLVLLDQNPLDDIRNTRRIRAVVAAGRLYDRAALDGLLEQAAADAKAR